MPVILQELVRSYQVMVHRLLKIRNSSENLIGDSDDVLFSFLKCTELAAGLEYNVHLLGVKGPTEKRVESVFFKPQLSKQRVGYAVKLIKESSAASTLVLFLILSLL